MPYHDGTTIVMAPVTRYALFVDIFNVVTKSNNGNLFFDRSFLKRLY